MKAECTGVGRWRIVLLLFAPMDYKDAPPARGETSLIVCDAHKEVTTVDDILTDESWAKIERSFAAIGRVMPVRERTRLEFVPC
jgi:hypothetical protein